MKPRDRHLQRPLQWLALMSVIAVFLSSCTVEHQYAQQFLQSWKPPHIMVIPPPIILKANLKPAAIPDSLKGKNVNMDSLGFAHSDIIRDIDDAVFLETYINAFIDALRNQGYTVYTPSALDTFLTVKEEAYVVDFAQVLMEESGLPFTDQATYDDTVYHKKFLLNAITLSTWFEMRKTNVEEDEFRLLFASHKITEQMQGRFTQNILNGEVMYRYTHYPILPEDVYGMGRSLGRKYASYLTDIFMNQAITDKLPAGFSPDTWYHWDPRSARIVRDWTDRLVEVDPSEQD